jgi:hypothetical protein
MNRSFQNHSAPSGHGVSIATPNPEDKMKTAMISKMFICAALASATLFTIGTARALEVRDHRGCPVFNPNCHSVVVIPPRAPPPQPPIDVSNPDIPPIYIPPTRQPKEPPHFPGGNGGGVWDDQTVDNEDGISCSEGRSIVRHHGFRRVRAADCNGDVFSYYAQNRHGRATVDVNMDGEIVNVSYIIY